MNFVGSIPKESLKHHIIPNPVESLHLGDNKAEGRGQKEKRKVARLKDTISV